MQICHQSSGEIRLFFFLLFFFWGMGVQKFTSWKTRMADAFFPFFCITCKICTCCFPYFLKVVSRWCHNFVCSCCVHTQMCNVWECFGMCTRLALVGCGILFILHVVMRSVDQRHSLWLVDFVGPLLLSFYACAYFEHREGDGVSDLEAPIKNHVGYVMMN